MHGVSPVSNSVIIFLSRQLNIRTWEITCGFRFCASFLQFWPRVTLVL